MEKAHGGLIAGSGRILVMANYAHHGFCGAVKKPYLVQEMSRVLDEVIKG